MYSPAAFVAAFMLFGGVNAILRNEGHYHLHEYVGFNAVNTAEPFAEVQHGLQSLCKVDGAYNSYALFSYMLVAFLPLVHFLVMSKLLRFKIISSLIFHKF